MKVNASAVASIAKWANENQSRMLQISTDFVFDGKKTAPYSPTDIASPLSVYGETKLQGEKGIFEFLPKSGIIKLQGKELSLYGIQIIPQNATCYDRKGQWPCGESAWETLTSKLNSGSINCTLAS